MKETITEYIVKKVYGEGASRYEDIMTKYWEFDRQNFVNSLELKNGDKVLEVGIGTGKNLLYYPSTVKVVGIDFTPEMLQLALTKKEKLLDKDITLLEMDAGQMTFKDNEFDAGLESFVLCVVPNIERVFYEIVRVTKPGARIAIFDYCRSKNPENLKWQDLISTVARTIGFPPGVIVWDPLRDYEKIITEGKIPLKILKIERHENPNPFLITCSMLLENAKK